MAVQRAAVRRARVQGRRWYLRGVLLAVAAAYAFARGGGVYLAVGIAMVVLAVMALSLGRSMRRQAGEMERKIELMERGA